MKDLYAFKRIERVLSPNLLCCPLREREEAGRYLYLTIIVLEPVLKRSDGCRCGNGGVEWTKGQE